MDSGNGVVFACAVSTTVVTSLSVSSLSELTVATSDASFPQAATSSAIVPMASVEINRVYQLSKFITEFPFFCFEIKLLRYVR